MHHMIARSIGVGNEGSVDAAAYSLRAESG